MWIHWPQPECGTGEFDEDKFKWGDFLKADRETWFGRGFAGVRGGARGGRNTWEVGGRGRSDGRGRAGMMGGRGDVNQPSWRSNALAYADG
jgi:hypothetical protein